MGNRERNRMKTRKKINKNQVKFVYKSNPKSQDKRTINICINSSCRLRKAGCRGFEGCPGYMSK